MGHPSWSGCQPWAFVHLPLVSALGHTVFSRILIAIQSTTIAGAEACECDRHKLVHCVADSFSGGASPGGDASPSNGASPTDVVSSSSGREHHVAESGCGWCRARHLWLLSPLLHEGRGQGALPDLICSGMWISLAAAA
jgi:hypothetical protein